MSSLHLLYCYPAPCLFLLCKLKLFAMPTAHAIRIPTTRCIDSRTRCRFYEISHQIKFMSQLVWIADNIPFREWATTVWLQSKRTP